jgi:hypothetical protein
VLHLVYTGGHSRRDNHVIVRANIDGPFDKRGLPDPLQLDFYFSARDDKIVQLIILRNQSST